MALVELARYPDAMKAEVARSFLQSYGIDVFLFDSGMNAAESASFAMPVRLMVLDEDRDAANTLLTEADLA